MANKLPTELIKKGISDGNVKQGTEDLCKILSGEDPSTLGSDTVIIKLDLPSSTQGTGTLYKAIGNILKVGG